MGGSRLPSQESTSIKGLHVCVPYNSLRLSALTEVTMQVH